MTTNFTEQEINTRRLLVKPIVEAAFGIRNVVLTQEKLTEQAAHWEAALSNVPTNQLRTLYREGLARRCTTAEQFAMVWDMKMESLAMRLEHQERQRREKNKKTNDIPSFILERWSGAEAQRA